MKLRLSFTPQRFFLVLLGGLAVVLLLGGGGYIWLAKQLQQHTTAWRTALAQSVVADSRIDQLTSLRKQYKQYSTLAGELDLVLPRQKDQSEFSLQLQALAAASGFNLTNVTFPAATSAPSAISQTSPVGSVLALPVTVQGTGNFAAIDKFLQKIEQLGRFNSVASVSINHSTDGRNLSSTINIIAYVKP